MDRKRIFTFILCFSMLSAAFAFEKPVPVKAADTQTQSFSAKTGVQTFTAKYTGKYLLEAYGGRGSKNRAGGGYTKAYVNLYAGDTLYIYVGGNGSLLKSDGYTAGGYNGGGGAYKKNAGTGGGATHIATQDLGTLDQGKYSSSNLLIVAGGSGGGGSSMGDKAVTPIYADMSGTKKSKLADAECTNLINATSDAAKQKTCFRVYGNGGGLSTEPSGVRKITKGNITASEGTMFSVDSSGNYRQNWKGTDGSSNSSDFCGYSGGGGGGYKGGRIPKGTGRYLGGKTWYNSYSTGLCVSEGGLGYVNSSLVYSGSTSMCTGMNDKADMTGYGNDKGSAKITYEGPVTGTLVIDTNSHGTFNGSRGRVTLTGNVGTSVDISSVVADSGYTFVGFRNIKGDFPYSKPKKVTSYTFGFKETQIMMEYVGRLSIYASKVSGSSDRYKLNVSNPGGAFYKVEYNTDNRGWTLFNKNGGSGSGYSVSRSFSYKGEQETYVVPYSGYYYVRATGATGLCPKDNIINGGLAEGYHYFEKGQKIYVSVGGTNSGKNGGWNGGGKAYDHANRAFYGGGGCTSLTFTKRGDGQLKNYKDSKAPFVDEVLIVAGGSGGPLHVGGHNPGGAGGGLVGGKGGQSPGGQQSGSLSRFGSGASGASGHDNAGSGGGWYGGGKSTSDDYPGAGGSSYIDRMINGNTVLGGANNLSSTRIANGTAYISMQYELYNEQEIYDIVTPDYAAPNRPSDGSHAYKSGKVEFRFRNTGDNGTTTQYRVTGVVLGDDNDYGGQTEPATTSLKYTSGVSHWYYYIDDSSTGDVRGNETRADSTEIMLEPSEAVGKYIHVAAIDKAGNLGPTYTYQFTEPIGTRYTVIHRKETLSGSFMVADTEYLSGDAGTQVTPDRKDYTGYNQPEPITETIKEDGSTEIVYDYTLKKYDVTCIDKIDNVNGKELGRRIFKDKKYGSSASGVEVIADDPMTGNNRTKGAYYEDFQLINYTTATVTGDNITVYRYFKCIERSVHYIDIVQDMDMVLGEKTVKKAIGVSVRGSDLGKNTAFDAYYEGFYYVSDTQTTVTVDGENTVYRYFLPTFVDVTYIDIDTRDNHELGRRVVQQRAYTEVKGIDVIEGEPKSGGSTADNAYYYNYALVAGEKGYTKATVKVDGTTVVYRYFTWLEVPIQGIVSWNDHDDEYDTRPDDVTVRLYRDGSEIDHVAVDTPDKANNYTFGNRPKYDPQTGKKYVYTVSQDTAYSKASLVTSEDKYETKQSGFDFLNSIRNTERPVKPDEPDDNGLYIAGNIYWEDNDDSLGFRPSTVTITLYQKGEDGKWSPFLAPIVVDANNGNKYIFDWLPKYWYDENDVPTKYEYRVEETFEAWYVKDGEVKKAYTIYEDQPNDFDFTNELIPDGPIIPFTEHVNTIIVKTNTDDKIRIILKPLELFVYDDYSVSYGDPNGNDIPTFANKDGVTISDIPGTRYEIIVDSKEYTLDDIKLALSENMELEKVGDKWYVTVKNVPEDAIGTLEITVSRNTDYYQYIQKIMNYFMGTKLRWVDTKLPEYFSVMMSDAIMVPGEPVSIEYMDSRTEDAEPHMAGDKVEILDYLGYIKPGSAFIGWSDLPDAEEAKYLAGDEIELMEDIVLYPIFDNPEEEEEPEITDMEDTMK